MTDEEREGLTQKCRYEGNPAHKRNPEDYGLTPPANPRPGATLCDSSGKIEKAEAERLLKNGIQKGMVSIRESNGWPQNIWSVREDGEVFEAQLGNKVQGTYHGYPLQVDDDFRSIVIKTWRQR